MAKVHKFWYGVCLLVSIIVNIFFLASNLYSGSTWDGLTWAKLAAEEAESVASIDCSGHGRAYLDGVVVYGKPVCECNSCFYGPDCSLFLNDCVADADSGDPLFLEPFWMQHAADGALLVSGWHRMSYSFPGQSLVSEELEKQIREVHAIAKNAITDGRYIVFGSGSTQVILAAVYALSLRNSSFPSQIVATAPYYPLYKTQTDYFGPDHFVFEGDTSMFLNGSHAKNVIEIVTSPNNPDGHLRKAVLHGSSVATIYDHAYYWPHYSAISAPSDEDIMIFTLSKLTGHAGSRFGWAIIRDESVYSRMKTYIQVSELGFTKDTQLRALKLLKAITKDHGKDIFDFGYKRMTDRWEKLSQVISSSKRFTLQEIPPQYCSFFNNVREPSPAYAWIKCEREEDTDCTAVLRNANIIGREGSLFNAQSRYVRLSLLKSQDDFEWLLHQLNELVSKEGGAEAM